MHLQRNKLNYDSCYVTVVISNKINKTKIQKIRYKAGDLFSSVFANCKFVRSYLTGKNKKLEAADYDFGDLVVADLNFDGLDDFAIKNDSGGNGGPLYNFYVQPKKGLFIIDKFLTDSVGSFPKIINKNKKTVTTLIHANVYEETETTFQFDPIKAKWKTTKQRLVKS